MKIPKGWRRLPKGTIIRATDKIWCWDSHFSPWGKTLIKHNPNARVLHGKFIRRIKRKEEMI